MVEWDEPGVLPAQGLQDPISSSPNLESPGGTQVCSRDRSVGKKECAIVRASASESASREITQPFRPERPEPQVAQPSSATGSAPVQPKLVWRCCWGAQGWSAARVTAGQRGVSGGTVQRKH